MVTATINEYKNKHNGETWYSATYDTSTYHNMDRSKVEAWLKDRYDNAEYYAQRKEETQKAMEIWYNTK